MSLKGRGTGVSYSEVHAKNWTEISKRPNLFSIYYQTSPFFSVFCKVPWELGPIMILTPLTNWYHHLLQQGMKVEQQGKIIFVPVDFTEPKEIRNSYKALHKACLPVPPPPSATTHTEKSSDKQQESSDSYYLKGVQESGWLDQVGICPHCDIWTSKIKSAVWVHIVYRYCMELLFVV